MIIINIANTHIAVITAGRYDADLLSVGDAEFFIVVAINEANSFGRLLQVLIQPIAFIAVTIDVIKIRVWIKPKHIRMVCSIQSKAIFILAC